ncbi:hypothetical protein WOLCODRAFT_28060 [Wolfiporia cocos MD-104 SS10]|uniref:Rho GTPase activation protein n=1 Tax=Wolfiporia cocos (strain MD-104) TaxID=742152 RepID=A0A2H3JG37_WOLCO|nr:hypothetical protein WOLCODRAFT_28060 [Wolfiporia cocos MD-104 SS10]
MTTRSLPLAHLHRLLSLRYPGDLVTYGTYPVNHGQSLPMTLGSCPPSISPLRSSRLLIRPFTTKLINTETTNYPFPVLPSSPSEPLSSSPPSRPSFQLSGPPPPSAGGASLAPVVSNGSSHVHSRSHSFTPRLASKLASPKTALPIPPSPKRKGSAGSDRQPEREREKNISGGSVGHGPSARSPFPFSLGGGGKSVSPSGSDFTAPHPTSPTMVGPPTIIEPQGEGADCKLQKRTSQVVYHAGFINRLTDFSPTAMSLRANYSYMSGGGPSALSKGWKPFKLVLKGSKLYFYKPPSDRSAAVKELFPTELVSVIEDEGLTDGDAEAAEVGDEDTGRGGRGGDREDMRRRRAFWGRTTHPALVVVGDSVERGTFEALVHEAVFATTFVRQDDSAPQVEDNADHASGTLDVGEAPVNVETGSEQATAALGGANIPHARYKASWREYTSAVLFCVPVLVGRAKFEAEFIRCSAYLITGAGEDHKTEEKARVQWLASQYLNYHGAPVNRDAWDDWRKETIPDFPADREAGSRLAGVPQTSSMQALYSASPRPDVSSDGFSELSPNLGAFSPRPNDSNKMLSFFEALGELPPSMPSLATMSSMSSSSQALRMTLEREGLTRDTLVKLDVQLIARSLSNFNRRFLKQVPDNFDAGFCFGQEDSEVQVAGDAVSESRSSASSLAPFVGSEEHPHWLTRLILIQVLVPEPVGSVTSPIVDSPARGPGSRMHTRSEVINVWAKVGELCRRTGDECSWRAISAALTSRPLARLDKVWKRVDAEAITTVQSWTQPHESFASGVLERPVAIPWAGDAKEYMRMTLDNARHGNEDEWRLDSLSDVRGRFEALRMTFALCSKAMDADTLKQADEVEALTRVWQDMQNGTDANPMASKFHRIDQFMSLSLAAEPRRRGLFEPYYWSRSTSQQSTPTLAAVLFPEPLPTVSFIDRELIVRGRLESSASINMQELQHVREVWLKAGGDGTMRTQATKPAGLDLGGTILPLFDGELLLLVQPFAESAATSRPTSRTPSRPPSSIADSSTISEKTFSRSPSIRVTPGSPPHGLDRKSSVLRRNSLPSISQRTSLVIPEVSSEKPLRVVVQAGTLERLVDVLAHGLQGVSVSVADDNGEMPLTDSKTREVKVDMDDFSEIWWSSFRSFLTPQVLFDFLRKRFTNARITSSSSSSEINQVVRKRSEVLETMNEWINRGGGAQDALDDTQLYKAFESFFAQSAEHDILQHISEDDVNAHQALAILDQIKKTLQLSFITQTRRPSRSPSLPYSSSDAIGVRSFGSDPPDIDKLEAEDLVNNVNSMASAALRNVNKDDLFITADILEVQSADRTGWFLPREPSSISDEVEIQCMSSYIMEVEPSEMISELAQESLYRLLPPSVRTCIRAFGILRKWLVSKLVGPRLSMHTRQRRMELMLRAIEVCRLRNAETAASDVPPIERPCVRSFVEALFVSAILSVESRMHYRVWQNIALARGTTCDTLSALLSKSTVSSVTSREALTVDIGWVLERMLEVISTPDILEGSAESTGVVNFDKRRTLHTLITSASGSAGTRRMRQRHHIDRRDLERLNAIEKEVAAIHFDLRTIREEAHREATQAGPIGAKRVYRPFQTLVALQQEKNKRDRHVRDRLSREKRHEQHRLDKREEYLNKAMNTRRQPAMPPKSHRNKKSVSSAFFQLMRPISSAFSSETLYPTGVKRTPAELDFTPSGKPSLVLSVVDARVAQFVNNERSYTFQLDTEDGGHYLLQALGKPEMKKWMDTIQHVSKTAAKRRLTYLGQNSKMQLSDHLLNQPATATQDPRAVFGVDLAFLLQREAGGNDVQPGAVPSVVERLIAEVEKRGLTEVGIYRIAGAHSEVAAYRDALNRGEWPIGSTTDIHAVCDLLKSWFRVLPGGIFPASTYSQILEAAGVEGDLSARLSSIRKVVHSLPDVNFDLLKRIVEHLEKVTDYEENTQMTAESLATVFSPNLIRAPNNDVGLFFANMSAGHRVTKLLIAHFHTIFDVDADQDPEFGRDNEEVELEEPIPEEDEDADLLCDNTREDPDLHKFSNQPPVLEVNLGSPQSFTFSVS